MRKQFLAILTAFALLASVGFVAAGPVSQVPLIGGESPPIYTESDFQPLVFLNEDGGRILDNGMYFTLPGSDGHIEVYRGVPSDQ